MSFVSCNPFLQAKLNILSITSMKYYTLSYHTQIYPLLQIFCECAHYHLDVSNSKNNNINNCQMGYHPLTSKVFKEREWDGGSEGLLGKRERPPTHTRGEINFAIFKAKYFLK